MEKVMRSSPMSTRARMSSIEKVRTFDSFGSLPYLLNSYNVYSAAFLFSMGMSLAIKALSLSMNINKRSAGETGYESLGICSALVFNFEAMKIGLSVDS